MASASASVPSPKLSIHEPDSDTDAKQDAALEACSQHRDAIVEILRQHQVIEAKIVPHAPGDNEDGLQFISCQAQFAGGDGEFTDYSRLGVAIEAVIGFEVDCDKLSLAEKRGVEERDARTRQ